MNLKLEFNMKEYYDNKKLKDFVDALFKLQKAYQRSLV